MSTFRDLEQKIDNVVELSSMCRGEWCRTLESQMDELDRELHDVVRRTCKSERHLKFSKVEDKIRRGYRNLSPNIHV
ncbi:MAG: hypothetical protein RBR09_11770 [Desulfobulbaceae bacterium]|jgi:hypothetical protein|nr:hypothetical protein [Desulfobulbaceae bacterium]MDY0351924.1 hypothetical protein [Desulfobulbaceae bacterium]